MKTILITGANGQLGRELQAVLSDTERYRVLPTDVDNLDITDAQAVNEFVGTNRPQFIVNCAAYTAVDAAEDNPGLARRLNADAVGILARAACNARARMIHVSTDYVFNGTSCLPYTEDMTTGPVSVYGRTKLEGEQQLTSILPEAVVLRTAWLYSPHGKNFVKTMLALGRSKDHLRVVFDQVGSPTYARDLALAIRHIIETPTWHPGIYHYSNEGAISWFDFTKAIHRLAGIGSCRVAPCRSNEFPAKAARPAFSVLDKSKFKSTFNTTVPYWLDSLQHCIKRIEND